jgi:signal transduction histidine kinase
MDVDPKPGMNDGSPAAETGSDGSGLLAIVLHELRGPLMPILNGAAILKNASHDAALVKRTALLIERQARNLAKLIEDLLDASRSRHGELPMQRRRIELRDVIDTCMETVAPFVHQHQQRLDVVVAQQAMELHADPLRLGQALQNLVFNAAKFSDRGGSIRIEARREDGDALVTVSDDGLGIEAAELETIFGLYTRARAVRTAAPNDGLGIGLYLARCVAEAHGGSLTARSEGPGLGSTFTLRIPCLGFDSEAAAALEPASHADPGSIGS